MTWRGEKTATADRQSAPAGENVRRPERRLTVCERAGEERQLRIKLRGGVVGFRPRRRARASRAPKSNAVEAKRPREREPLSLPKIPRHYPAPAPLIAPATSITKRAACAARLQQIEGRTLHRLPAAVRITASGAACGLRLAVDVDGVGELPAVHPVRVIGRARHDRAVTARVRIAPGHRAPDGPLSSACTCAA